MNTNIILDGVSAIINQAIATAVAEAIKPLQDRITALEEAYTEAYTDWKGMEHVAAKAVQPMQDRINMLETQVACSFDDEKKMVGDRLTALEIQQSMGKAVFQMADIDFNEAVRNVLDGYNFVSRNDMVDMVTARVDDAIENYDFSDKIEEGINNYDFSDIIAENMPDLMSEDTVQGMIDDALSSLVVVRT